MAAVMAVEFEKFKFVTVIISLCLYFPSSVGKTCNPTRERDN